MAQCNLKGERCTFRCTGYDGRAVWEKMHRAADSIDCEECRVHGKQLVSGLHDVVNVGLGKHAYDGKNLKRFVDEVNCVYESCKREGRC